MSDFMIAFLATIIGGGIIAIGQVLVGIRRALERIAAATEKPLAMMAEDWEIRRRSPK